MRVLLGIAGGIAAYKAPELVRALQQRGHEVQAMLTRGAREFVAPATLEALTGAPVLSRMWGRAANGPASPGAPIEHIAVAQSAAVLVVAPATAHVLARLAHGLADDYLTTVALATPARLVVAPAMNVAMWEHAATQANMEILRARGAVIVPPEEGYLACGMTGAGRMASVEAIAAAVERAGGGGVDWAGQTVLVTAGPTREAVDAVRYLSNRSSGRMGYALAQAARERGARVILVSGPTALAAPGGVERIEVTTAAEMAAAALEGFEGCTAAILAAAVADYRPARPSSGKIKKTGGTWQLELEPTMDILAEMGRRKRHQILVGFAAETDRERALDHARAKRAGKNADLIVLNDVSQPGIGFDASENAATLIGADEERELPRQGKLALAHAILDAIPGLCAHVHTLA